MISAIAGDTIGSVYEFANIKTKDFKIFKSKGRFRDDFFFTDDSVCTGAVARAILDYRKSGGDLNQLMKKRLYEFGNLYPGRGYGGGFHKWLHLPFAEAKPYNSYGNGAIMRVSPTGFLANTEEEAKAFAIAACSPSHNHPEAVKWATIIATMIFWMRNGMMKDEVKKRLKPMKELDFTLDEIRPTYSFDVTTQGSAPQAIVSFLEANDFEDTIRNAISIGGDSDTLAATAAPLAEACYGLPDEYRDAVFAKLKECPQTELYDTMMEVTD